MIHVDRSVVLKRLRRDDVNAHQMRFFAPNNAFLVAAGEFEPLRLRQAGCAAVRRVGAVIDSVGFDSVARRRSKGKARRVPSAGEQTHLLIGHLGIARQNPDFDALCVLDHILGTGPGFTDRLGRILREEMAVAYSVGGGITETADHVPGLFRLYVGTSVENAERASQVVAEQVSAMHNGAFSDAEFDRARRYVAGSWVFDYQTVSQRADRLLELERWGLPLDEPVGRASALID